MKIRRVSMERSKGEFLYSNGNDDCLGQRKRAWNLWSSRRCDETLETRAWREQEYQQTNSRFFLKSREPVRRHGDALCAVPGVGSRLEKRKQTRKGWKKCGVVVPRWPRGLMAKKKRKNEADVAENRARIPLMVGWYVWNLCILLSLKWKKRLKALRSAF